VLYIVLTVFTCFLTKLICVVMVTGEGLISLMLRGIICLIIPNIMYIIIFSKNEEFQYLKEILIRVVFKSKEKRQPMEV
ncbi:hypothetical protein V7112_19100, partial [Bacillus sp. JJ1566]